MARTVTAALAPHSWDLEHWPEHVYPHTESRARYLLRAYRDELLRAGVLSRVGRELVVNGARYCRWLERQAAEVPDFVTAATRVRTQTQDSGGAVSRPPFVRAVLASVPACGSSMPAELLGECDK